MKSTLSSQCTYRMPKSLRFSLPPSLYSAPVMPMFMWSSGTALSVTPAELFSLDVSRSLKSIELGSTSLVSLSRPSVRVLSRTPTTSLSLNLGERFLLRFSVCTTWPFILLCVDSASTIVKK